MAWTDPQTWAAGNPVTAAELNEQLRDNMTYLKDVADGVAFSGIQIKRDVNTTSAQVIPNATWTAVVFHTVLFEYGDWWTSGSNITVPATAVPDTATAIVLLTSLKASWEADATGTRRVRVNLNGTSFGAMSLDALNDVSQETELNMVEFVSAVAGGVVTFEVYQDSGGSLDLRGLLVNVVKYAPVS